MTEQPEEVATPPSEATAAVWGLIEKLALADPKAQQTFAEGGMDPYPPDELTPEAASALLKREIKLWGDVIRANNIAAQ